MNKNTSFRLSDQVKSLLYYRGFSHAFNWLDYTYYKEETKGAFNRALAIAEALINSTDQESDFAEYIF